MTTRRKEMTLASVEPVFHRVNTCGYTGLTRHRHTSAQIQPLNIYWHGGSLSFLCGCSPSNHKVMWISSNFSKDHNKQFVFVSLSTLISKLAGIVLRLLNFVFLCSSSKLLTGCKMIFVDFFFFFHWLIVKLQFGVTECSLDQSF